MSDIDKKDLEKGRNFLPDWNKISGIKHKVLPVCLQHAETGEVLGIMYMDEVALRRSITEKVLTLFSTSRGKIWMKGEESGEKFRVVGFRTNCEQNSLLCSVVPMRAGICHVKDDDGKPHATCFYRELLFLPDGDYVLVAENDFLSK